MVNETVQLTIKAILDESNFKSRVKGLLDGIKPPKDILGVKENAAKLKSALNELRLPDNIASKFSGQFSSLDAEIEKYQALLAKPIRSKADISKIQESGSKINQILNEITRDIMEINSKKISPNVDTSKIKTLEAEAERLKTEITNINNEVLKSTSKIGGEKLSGLNIIDKITQGVARSKKNKPLVEEMKQALGMGDYQEAIKLLRQLESVELKGLFGGKNAAFGADKIKGAEKYKAAIQELIALVEKLQKEEQENGKNTGLKNKVQTYKEINSALNTLYQKGNLQADEELKQMGAAAQESAKQVQNLNQQYSRAAESNYSKGRQVSDLKNQVQYFFGLQNQVYLFRRAIRDTIDTVKELDASMTETAVVTDFSVSDMWAQLPEYTAAANELGSTINDVYQANTLYFQQGLDSEQAMGLGIETLKMARIAGMDAAQATDLMTAALRGFNMELNQTSAQRVNDVYSKLAAITASDTQEIGTAVSKTASLASSAGMDLEETSALLAQVVETTREAPETAGTALKTIIARFGEVKELFSQGQLLGTDEEGEEIQVNRVDAALQSAGINLKEFVAGNKGLGEIFVELSKRWKGLSTAQQRYIATQSAGARQQSRFIAMLQDTERLQYLLDEAYNSNGASAIQFEKTQESVEAKTNKLKNAWDEFTMGLMNEKALKGIVDFGKDALSVINDLIEGISNGIKNIFGEGVSDVTKGALTFGTAFTALGLGGKGANALLGGLGGMITPGESILKGFKGGFFGSKENAIIGELQELNANVAAIRYQESQKNVQNKQLDLQQFKQARDSLRNVTEKTPTIKKDGVGTYTKQTYKISDINSSVKDLAAPYQSLLLRNQPGFLRNMQNDFNTAFNEINPTPAQQALKRKVEKSLKQEFKGGSKNFDEYTRALFDPKQIESSFGSEIASKMRQRMIKEWVKESSVSERLAKIEEKKRANPELDSRSAVDEILYERNAGKERELSRTEKIANSFGKVGSAVTNAGMAVNQFGVSLQGLGFEKAGAAAQQFGNIIMGLGPAISSLGQIPDMIDKNPISAAAIGATAVFTGLLVAVNHFEKEAREKAEKIQKDYEKTSKSVEGNLSKINSMKLNFGTLAEGVDDFGNNLTLNDTQYKEYQEDVEKLIKMSPELIKGYNAEGKAIIDKTKALELATQAQERQLEQARKEYTSPESMNDMIKGIRAQEKFSKHKTYKDSGFTTGEQYQNYVKNNGKGFEALLAKETENFNKALTTADIKLKNNQSKAINQIAGREIDLSKPSTNDLKFISDYYNDIQNLLEQENKNLNNNQKEALEKGVKGLADGWKEIENEIQPLMEQTNQYLAKEGLSLDSGAISDKFTTAFTTGIQNISLQAATENWSGHQLQEVAKNFGTKMASLSGEDSRYVEIMDEAADAQKKYIEEIDDPSAIDNYKESVKDLSNELRGLGASANDGTAAGEAIAETFNYSADQIDTYATTMETSISSALNTLSDEFEQAKGAYETFQKEVEESGDYYTAAEGFNKIYEEAIDGLDDVGRGSKTFWKAANRYVSDDLLEDHSVNKVKAKMEKIHSWFVEGQQGTDNFFNDLKQLDGIKGEDGKSLVEVGKNGEVHLKLDSDKDYEFLASKLGSSLDAFSAALDKSRQYLAMDTANYKQLYATIKEDKKTLVGQNKGEDGKPMLYYNKGLYEAEAKEAFDYDPTLVKKSMQNVQKAGVTLISLSELSKKDKKQERVAFNKDVGISAKDDLVKTVSKLMNAGFVESGEITKYLQSKDLYGKDLQDSEVTKAIEEVNSNKDVPPAVSNIEQNTASILTTVQSMAVAQGMLDSATEKKYKEEFSAKNAESLVGKINEATTDKGKAQAYENLTKENDRVQGQIDFLKESRKNATGAEKDKYDQLIGVLEGYQTTLKDGISKFEKDKDKNDVYKDTESLINKVKNQDGYTEKDVTALENNASKIYETLHTDNLREGVNQLHQLEGELGLSSAAAKTLNNEFIKLHATDLSKLSNGELKNLLTSLGLSNAEVKKLIKQIKYLANVKNIKTKITAETGDGKKTTKKQAVKASALYTLGTEGKSAKEKVTSALKDYGLGDKEIKKIIKVGLKIEGLEGEDKKDALKSLEKRVKNFNKDNKNGAKIPVTVQDKKATKGLHQIEKGREKIVKPVTSIIKGNNKDALSKINMAKVKAEEYKRLNPNTDIKATDKASSVINSITSAIFQMPDKHTIDIETRVSEIKVGGAQGSGKKSEKSKNSDENKDSKGKRWTGTRNTLPVNPSLSFGSAANGLNNGITKVKKETRTTLTGEKGYEVAWLPSENRSTILGLKGPEIVDLPRDAVIYNHDQSKKIVKGNKKRPDLGSAANGIKEKEKGIFDGILSTGKSTINIANVNIGKTQNSVDAKYTPGGGKGSGSGSKSKSTSTSTSKDTKSAAKDAKSAAKNSKKASGKWLSAGIIWGRITGKISSWWDNMSRKIDAATRTFNKAMDKVSKALNSTVATGPKVFKALTEASKKAAVAIQNNIIAYKKASKTLNRLVGHKDADKINEYNNLNKKKKRTKKQNKRLKKLRAWGKKKGYIKKNGKLSPKGNKTRKKRYVASISYDKTGTKILGKGKKGKKLAKKYKTFLSLKNKKKKTKKFKSARKALRKQGIINKNGKLTKKGKKIIKTKKINKNKKEKINLSKYIKRDKKTGALVIDDKALNKIKDKNKKKAIQDKANEKINDYNQKRNDALDALKDIQDQATSTGEELYEKFHSWKRTLEEIEVISQRIAELSERISIAEAKSAKANNELLAGKTADIAKAAETMSKAIEDFIRFNEQSIDEIRQSRTEIGKKMDKENSDTDEKKAVTDTTKKYDDITAKINELKSKYNLKSVEDLYRLSSNEQYIELLAKQREAELEKEKAESDLKVQQAVTKIVKSQKNADGTYTYNIDWGLFDQYANSEDYTSEQMDEIQERISTLISLNSDYLKTMTDELNTENAILERLAQIRKDISDGSQKLAQVLMDREQRVVDNLSKINDTIKNATSKILDDVRDALDKRRQQDQNQKTEKSISDKQNRLAYLQNDTAGGHQVEILQLQKEIGDEQQSYRETLEDQLLTNLQKQADQASAQRERQIALLQTMVNWNKESGVYARQIDEWLNDPKEFETHIKNAFRESILGDQFETWITKENASEEAFSETSTLTANVDKYIKDRKELIDKANNAIRAADQKYAEAQDGKYQGYVTPEQLATLKSRTDTLRRVVDSGTQGEINDALGNADNGTGVLGAQKIVQSGMDRKAEDDRRAAEEAARRAIEEETKRALEEEERRAAAEAARKADEERRIKEQKETRYLEELAQARTRENITFNDITRVQEAANQAGYSARTYLPAIVQGRPTWKKVLTQLKGKWSADNLASTFSSETFIKAFDAVYGKGQYKKHKGKGQPYAYKTGGLADYTGPAWIDGTKSKPELVLDAQDTKNFLALRDTLSGLQNNQFTPQSNGDLNFDIDINVEKIDNDYDVKKVAEAVKKEIVQSAKYRNVNIVRNLK